MQSRYECRRGHCGRRRVADRPRRGLTPFSLFTWCPDVGIRWSAFRLPHRLRGSTRIRANGDRLMGSSEVQLRVEEVGSGPLCEQILASLPEWFGLAESNANYVSMADRSPTIVASVDGVDVGLLIAIHHSDFAAEVRLMVVRPEHHRAGVGTAMLHHLETQLAADGVEFLQLKTLAASDPDPGYAATRAFYDAYGFRHLEEFPTLWNPDNPALQMIKTVSAR